MITIEKDFNVIELLKDSVFYPASGIDGKGIEFLIHKSKSFVQVDYSVSIREVRTAMENDFKGVGYKLKRLTQIGKEEIIQPYNPILNEHEQSRINKNSNIKERYELNNFSSFMLRAIYENESGTEFSLLHVGAEACSVFNSLYVKNNINPKAVVIINPSEGFGDNWTKFTDPDFRFHKMLKANAQQVGQTMPEYLLTSVSSNEQCFWQGYKFVEEFTTIDQNFEIMRLELFKYSI